nr:7-deoxyloganetin glucosyltransferase-like [Tanacetum cinerariifolium]
MLHMKEDETIDTFTTKLTTIVNKVASLGHTMEDGTLLRKLLNVVPDRLDGGVTKSMNQPGIKEDTYTARTPIERQSVDLVSGRLSDPTKGIHGGYQRQEAVGELVPSRKSIESSISWRTNCWYSCNRWGIGMDMDSDVNRKQVEKLVRSLMVEKKGKEMRRMARIWKRKSESSSSWSNIDNLINQVLLRS